MAAAGLGALSAAALPPLHVIPVLLLAVPGLLCLIDGSRGAWAAARRGFWFGFGHHVFGLYWITEAILLESARYWWLVPFAVPALSALLALFIAAPCALARLARPGWRRALMLASAWTLFDLARQYVGTGFPWNPWGSVWAIPGLLGDVARASAQHVLLYATIALATTLWAGHLRRHLMLYRVFMPRFLMAGVVSVVVQLWTALVAVGGLRWSFMSVAEVFGWS